MEILQQGPAQVAHTQNNGGMAPVDPQNIGNLPPEAVHIVAIPLLSELAKAGEILTDLGGGEMHGLAQSTGGDAHHPRLLQLRQLPVIPGQAADHRGRYLCVSFHPAHVRAKDGQFERLPDYG